MSDRLPLPADDGVTVVPGFLAPEEHDALLTWANAQFETGQLLSNRAGAGRFFARYSDGDPRLPPGFAAIRARAIGAFAIDEHELEPHLRWFLGCNTEGAYVHEHLDDEPPGKHHVRINIMLSRPFGGGVPILGGRALDVNEGDLWCFNPAALRHASTPVTGTRLRFVLSIGVLVPAAGGPASSARETCSPAALPNELELLLACGRREFDAAAAARAARAVDAGVRWDRVLTGGAAHGLLTHVDRAASHGVFTAPRDVAARLREHAVVGGRRALQMNADLLLAWRTLQERGLDPIAIGGPIIAAHVFGAAGDDAGDIELLVKDGAADDAIAALVARGYQRDAPHKRVSVVAPSGIALRVRDRLMGQSLRPRARTLPLAGSAVPALDDADLLILRSARGASRGWTRLDALATIAELIRAGRVDDARVAERAAALGVRHAVAQGRYLAALLFPDIRHSEPVDPAVAEAAAHAVTAIANRAR